MATVAVEDVQAVLDPGGTGNVANIQQRIEGGSILQNYVVGINGFQGKCKWISTTDSDSAAVQGAAILAALVL